MASLAKVISKLPKKKGVKAYHSSPHDFDKFEWSPRTSMTGEGAQAYGAGLYFAESPKVSGRGGDYWRQFFNKMKSGPERTAAGAMFSNRFDPEEAIGVLERGTKYHSDRSIPGRYAEGPDVELGHSLLADESQQALEMLRSGKIVGPRTYEVNIDADPNAFLDWDKALSEQPEAVRRKLADTSFLYHADLAGMKDPTGSQLLREIIGDHPSGTKPLKEAGIPGIKFLDAGSRGKGIAQVQVMYKGQPHGDPIPVQAWNQVDQLTNDYRAKGYDVEVQDLGTRNYVVFDDKLISIVRKYGIAGASAMLGYNILDGMSNAQAAELQKQAYPTDSKNTNTKSLANFLKDRGAAATQGASTMFDGETGRDKNIPDQLADIGTQAVAGINRGVASLPGLPKDLAGLADWGLDAFGVSDNETLRNVINPGRMWPISGEDSIKAWESVAGDLPEAETDLGAVTDFLAQFATPGPGELGGAMSLSALMALPANKRLVTLVDEAKRLGVEPKVLANYYSGIKYNNPKIMSPNATAPEDWMKLVEDVPSQTPVKRRPEGLIGRTVYSAPGDMASTSIVHGINGRNVNPAQPGGGPRFTVKQKRIDEGAVWAGAPTAATGAINKSKAITDAGGDPLMINTTMASDATDYNAATADLVLQDIQAGKKTKAERKRLNDFLLEKFGPNGPDKTRIDNFDPKSFPGIDTDKNLEKTRALLLNNAPGPHGQMRTRMVKAFDGRDALDMGAPEIGPIRFAIADPDFALNDAQWAGGSLFKVDPNGKAIPSDHGTYAASYPGWGEGELDGRVPVGYLMPDWVKTNARQPLKPDGTLSSNDWYTFGRQGPTQKITEEMVDRWYKLGLFK